MQAEFDKIMSRKVGEFYTNPKVQERKERHHTTSAHVGGRRLMTAIESARKRTGVEAPMPYYYNVGPKTTM